MNTAGRVRNFIFAEYHQETIDLLVNQKLLTVTIQVQVSEGRTSTEDDLKKVDVGELMESEAYTYYFGILVVKIERL